MDVKQGQCPACRLPCLCPGPRALTRGPELVPPEVRAPAAGLRAPPAPASGILPGVRYLVSDEVRALRETLAALAAPEGPVAAGSPLPRGQGLRPRRRGLEGQPLAAVVGALAGVLALVLGQGRAVPEALATAAALVGSLGRVRPQMQEQARGAREGLAAHAAGERLLPGVRAPVAAQGRVLVEGPPAVLARIGLLPGVDPPVHREVRAVAERLAAVRALVGLVARVDALVLHQRGVLAEGLAALLARVRPLTRMDPPVHREVRVVVEGLAAVRALVGFVRHLAARRLGFWFQNRLTRRVAAVTVVMQLSSRGAHLLTDCTRVLLRACNP